MMRAKLSPNLISFVLVRRGEWLLKVSVYKNKYIMVLAQHVFDMEHTIIRFFLDQNQAADFIEQLVEGENDNQSF
jgi:presenilin-like A22 family membrane protease